MIPRQQRIPAISMTTDRTGWTPRRYNLGTSPCLTMVPRNLVLSPPSHHVARHPCRHSNNKSYLSPYTVRSTWDRTKNTIEWLCQGRSGRHRHHPPVGYEFPTHGSRDVSAFWVLETTWKRLIHTTSGGLSGSIPPFLSQLGEENV
jgi:hypothetical protein